MDKLSDLPEKKDTIKTKEENEVISQFFPPSTEQQATRNSVTTSQTQNSSISSKLNWKIIGLTAILFVALANPWIDSIFCKIPYCGENVISLLGIKTLIFLMILIMINLFC